MPLSEEELRLLEQMERALAEEDPRFVSALEGRNLVLAARLRVVLAAVVLLGGGVVVALGLWQRMVWLGVVGFLIMIGAASLGLIQVRSHRLVARLGRPDPAPDDEFQGLRVIQGGRASRGSRGYGPQGHPSRGSRSGLGRRYAAWLNRLEARWLHRRDQSL